MCCGLEAATKEVIFYADSETIPLPLHIRQANIKNNMGLSTATRSGRRQKRQQRNNMSVGLIRGVNC